MHVIANCSAILFFIEPCKTFCKSGIADEGIAVLGLRIFVFGLGLCESNVSAA